MLDLRRGVIRGSLFDLGTGGGMEAGAGAGVAVGVIGAITRLRVTITMFGFDDVLVKPLLVDSYRMHY
jgi:hypothetical protein